MSAKNETAQSSHTCTNACWDSVECDACGRIKAPRGRSLPLETVGGYCSSGNCDGYSQMPRAPHLFGPHDSDRAYFDERGWQEHKANCERCRSDEP